MLCLIGKLEDKLLEIMLTKKQTEKNKKKKRTISEKYRAS